MVIAFNTRTILSIYRDMKVVKYASIGWGDDEAVQLAEVLPPCTSATELTPWLPRDLGSWGKGPRGGVCRGRDAEARETLPQRQPDWR